MERGCPSCGRMIDASSSKCPYCNYDFTDLNKMFRNYDAEMNFKSPKYAGFIKRMAANGIDYLLFLIIFTVIEFLYLYFFMKPIINDFSFESVEFSYIIKSFIPYLVMPIIYFFYCVFMQYSKSMATLGEKFLGIEVVDDLDSPLTLGLSFKRNIFRILNVLTCGIGLLIIIFTKKKQSLSDMASNTFVVNKLTNEKYAGMGYSHLFKRFLAFVIDILFLYVIYLLFGYLQDYVAGLHIEARSTILNVLPIIMVVIMLLYFPYTESHGSSFGKSLMKIKVTDLDGNKIGLFSSFFRFISLFIEILILPFGTLLAFVTPRKQTFKDLFTKTIVINRF